MRIHLEVDSFQKQTFRFKIYLKYLHHILTAKVSSYSQLQDVYGAQTIRELQGQLAGDGPVLSLWHNPPIRSQL